MSFFGYRENDKKKDGGLGAFGQGIGLKYNGFGEDEECRFFTDLNGIDQNYSIDPFSLSSDFELEFKMSTIISTKIILGQSNNSSGNYLYYSSATTLTLRTSNNVSMSFSGGFPLNDGKTHHVRFKRVGVVIECFINGSSVGTANDNGALVFDLIGTYNIGSLYFNGILSDVKVTDGTTLIRDYPIDEDFSTTSTLVDYGTDGLNGTAENITSSEEFCKDGVDWIGLELVVNGDFVDDSAWIKNTGWTISSGVATASSIGVYVQIYQPIVKQYRTYRTIYTVVGISSGAFNMRLGSTNLIGTNRSSLGAYTEIIKVTTSSTIFSIQGAVAGTNGSVDDVSVKRILQAP